MEHLFFNPSQEQLVAETKRTSTQAALFGNWPDRGSLELERSWPQFRYLEYDHNRDRPAGETWCSFERFARIRGWNIDNARQDCSLRTTHRDFAFSSGTQREVDGRFLAFLQSWLIFGFLEDMLEREIRIECLTRLGESGHYFLDTHYLTFLLHASSYNAQNMGEEGKQRLALKIQSIHASLERLFGLLEALHTPKINPGTSDGWLRVDRKHFLCLLLRSGIVLCSHLLTETVFHHHRKQFGFDKPFTTPPVHPRFRESSWSRMIGAGFCPTFVKDNANLLCTMEWLARWGMKTRFSAYENHTTCNANRCGLENAPGKGPRHSDECSRQGCVLEWPDLDEIAIAIAGELIPFVQISWDPTYRKAGLVVSSHNSESISSFSAVSHVWRHGLGSTTEEGLFTCQLKVLSEALGCVDRADGSKVTAPFWIDSVCIPGDRAYRPLAVQRINTIFANVGQVFLIDGAVRRLDLTGHASEGVYAAILSSAWRTRLWTFQEDYVSHELVAVFKNERRTLRLGQLMCPQGAASVPAHMTNVNAHLEMKLRRSMCRDPPNAQDVGGVEHPHVREMRTLLAGVRALKATKPDDEALILATALGLPTRDLLAVRGDERIAAFYNLVGRVPRNWLFFFVPRISTPRNKWAPRTWLLDSTDMTEIRSGFGAISDRESCTVTPHGLEGNFSLVNLGQARQSLRGHTSRLICTQLQPTTCFLLARPDQYHGFEAAIYDRGAAYNVLVFRKPLGRNHDRRNDYDSGITAHGRLGRTEKYESDEGLLAYASPDSLLNLGRGTTTCRIVGTVKVLIGSRNDLRNMNPDAIVYGGAFVENARLRFP